MVTSGLRFNTQRTYSTAQRFYLKFCQLYHLPAVPASESQLLLFVAYAHAKSLRCSTIMVYLSGISSLHTINGFEAPPTAAYRIKLALRALQDMDQGPVHCKPITFQLLQYITSVLPSGYLCLLYTAMLSLGFYGALHGSEYAATMAQGTLMAPKLVHLQFVLVNELLGFMFTIPKSKTSRVPITIRIGCANITNCASACAVCAMLANLRAKFAIHGHHPETFLFTGQDGRPVTKDQLNQVIKQSVLKLGLAPDRFSTHSLRAGAATTAVQVGLNEHDIKQLGHWSSSAYIAYIRQNDLHSFTYSHRLASQQL